MFENDESREQGQETSGTHDVARGSTATGTKVWMAVSQDSPVLTVA